MARNKDNDVSSVSDSPRFELSGQWINYPDQHQPADELIIRANASSSIMLQENCSFFSAILHSRCTLGNQKYQNEGKTARKKVLRACKSKQIEANITGYAGTQSCTICGCYSLTFLNGRRKLEPTPSPLYNLSHCSLAIRNGRSK